MVRPSAWDARRIALGLAMLAQGCAAVARVPEAAAPSGGHIEVRAGLPGVVIGAPHGTSDRGTDALGRDLSRLTGFGLVAATGFSHLDGDGRRYNVNRPTESVAGSAARLELETEASARVYRYYRRSVEQAAQGPLRLYVEVHGNAHLESAGRVEIATVGLSRDDAWRLKTLLELVRDARVAAGDGVPRLEIWIESLDPVRYTASAAKRAGMLGRSERALHIELPRAARTEFRQAYTEVLADFLSQSAALLLVHRP